MSLSEETKDQIHKIIKNRGVSIDMLRTDMDMKSIATRNSIILLMGTMGVYQRDIAAYLYQSIEYVQRVIDAAKEDCTEPKIRTTNYTPRGSTGRKVGGSNPV
ncbi:MAG: hypothetical protein ACRBCK_10000 [Alphaproteobacteria bacterium]